jgi:antitoxin MazE
MKAKLCKWGNSLALRLPKSLTDELCLVEDSLVECEIQAGQLVIRPLQPGYTLADLVSQIDEKNRHAEVDWGPARGAEFS